MPFTFGGDFNKKPISKKQYRVFVEKRKGKTLTIVKNFDGDLKALASKLKSKLSCGGTVKDDQIELQGDHLNQVKAILQNKAR